MEKILFTNDEIEIKTEEVEVNVGDNELFLWYDFTNSIIDNKPIFRGIADKDTVSKISEEGLKYKDFNPENIMSLDLLPNKNTHLFIPIPAGKIFIVNEIKNIKEK